MSITIAWSLVLHVTHVLASLTDYYVDSIPGAESIDLSQMYAGSIDLVNETSRNEPMFFWLYESKFRASKPKTLIWFNGGPGCSSLDGALLELGPLRFMGDDKFQYNEGNWGEFLNVLYLDQPLGTGYSFVGDVGDYVGDVEQAARMVDEFLAKWLQEFPQHAHDDFYLGGESYAGQYIPYLQKSITAIEPKGIILCNPWIDAAHQYLSYVPMIKELNLVEDQYFPTLDRLHEDCIQNLATHTVVPSDDPVCNKILTFVLENPHTAGKCMNIYNYNLEDTFPACGLNWPEGVKDMPSYLNRPEVLDALHVHPADRSQKWTECSSKVSQRFRNFDKPTGSAILPDILAQVPVLIMVGDADFICNYHGLDDMVKTLNWGDQPPTSLGWLPDEKLEDLSWNDKVFGSVRTGRNLTMARIFGGSHMIPVDKQFETRALVHKFTGVTDKVDQLPSFSKQVGGDGPQDDPEEDTASDAADKARLDAFKKAGLTALVVIIVLIAALVLWLIFHGDVHLSWSHISSGFARALLHVGAPKVRRPFEYVNLNTFRPSTLPTTIVEEEEEEVDDFNV